MSEKELREFFKFDESDLAANRAGQLSAKQVQVLAEGERGATRIFVGMGIGLVLLAALITYVVISSTFHEGYSFADLSNDQKVGLTLGLGLPWLILGFLAVGAFMGARGKSDFSVQKTEGKVKFVKVERNVSSTNADGTSSSRTVQQYELRVGPTNFENVDEKLLNMVDEGKVYAFYYAKAGKIILSAERTRKGK